MLHFEKSTDPQSAIARPDALATPYRALTAEERQLLTPQLRSDTVSTSANQPGGPTPAAPDFAKLLSHLTGPLDEVVSQLHSANRQSFIGETAFRGRQSEAEAINRILGDLRASLHKD